MKSYSILLVDDEAEILELNKEVFESYGFFVLTALNVSEAEIILRRREVDYILSDYTMPLLNGSDFLNIIRSELKLNTPVSFLTAYSISITPELHEKGVQKIFSKPIDVEEVADFVQNYFESV
ncbi:MAG: response regulator [Pseudobdellovibrio sp.]